MIADKLQEDTITFSTIAQVMLTKEVVCGTLSWCCGMTGYVSRLTKAKDNIEIEKPYTMIKIEEKDYAKLNGRIKGLLADNDHLEVTKRVDGTTFIYFLYETYYYDPKKWEGIESIQQE
jgi:hypothetical protein